MKHISEYRDAKIVKGLVESIHQTSTKPIALMEVCGGHTMSIQKFGIPSLLPETISLLSGPGCPVCVTDIRYIDHAIALARRGNTIIATFGDLIRVPGSTSSLEKEMASGVNVHIVYSILNAIELAAENPDKEVIFLAIGFETTAPGTAAGILTAAQKQLPNFSILSTHKIMPPAMEAIVDEGAKIDGYICPGHVAAITGAKMFAGLVEKHKIGCVVSGFEPSDLLQAILQLVVQFESNSHKLENAYQRAVKMEGNQKAQAIMTQVFEPEDSYWRGFGVIPRSGLRLKSEFQSFDAKLKFQVDIEPTREEKGCICGEILKGLKKPTDCKLFGKACTPANPVGACMVSNEGACAAYFKYKR
ncbi:MAG: hydrogenase formation protein HypD [Bacteroidales bacterium]|nr:hydrogenase formation protein HypD [Bacteroidales bacterium]MCF8457670.1 hydrogenase formation protein HypD [Bacteroidales bacterium]